MKSKRMKFEILSKDPSSKARIGKIKLERGVINTPIFMPVGTLGSVRGVTNSTHSIQGGTNGNSLQGTTNGTTNGKNLQGTTNGGP